MSGKTEQTGAGEQRLAPGVAPVTLADRLAARAAAPMAPRRNPATAQRSCDHGLFDVESRRQTDLIDAIRAAARAELSHPQPKED